jgi:hypothetical protein
MERLAKLLALALVFVLALVKCLDLHRLLHARYVVLCDRVVLLAASHDLDLID